MKRRKRYLVVALLVGLSILAGAAACTQQMTMEQIESGLFADMPTEAATADIKYQVQASNNNGFSLTYENKTGDTEQKDVVTSAWDYEFTGDPGDFLYVSAQLDGSGSIECWIYIDGVEVSNARSTGEYVIAKCSE